MATVKAVEEQADPSGYSPPNSSLHRCFQDSIQRPRIPGSSEVIRVFHGQDEFSIGEQVARIRESVGSPEVRDPNTSSYEGTGFSFMEVLGAASSAPFLADRRLVIVRGLLERLDGNDRSLGDEWTKMADGLSDVPATTELLFVENVRLRRGGRGLRSIGPQAEITEFPSMRGANLDSWISERFAAAGAMADSGAVARLAWVSGGNLRLLDQEIRKLVLYADGRSVTRNDVDGMVSEAREANIFATIDAVLERRPERAMRMMYSLLENGSTVSSVIGLMARQVRILLVAKHLTGSNLERAEIGRRVGVTNNFVLDKTLRQTGRFSSDYLADIHRLLLSADMAIKSGQLNDRLALEILAGRLSAG